MRWCQRRLACMMAVGSDRTGQGNASPTRLPFSPLDTEAIWAAGSFFFYCGGLPMTVIQGCCSLDRSTCFVFVFKGICIIYTPHIHRFLRRHLKSMSQFTAVIGDGWYGYGAIPLNPPPFAPWAPWTPSGIIS
ncbi:hypothetical protein BZA77DRAFT_57324 [Pyronema omphalodes]|nr:hypothetical protein BZA77DRAFT_57324 [Pyronema omphalodes]